MSIYDLLATLDKFKISYSLVRRRDEAISLDVTIPGERIEIDAFEDGHTEVARFFGSEEIVGEIEDFIEIFKNASC